MALGLPDVMRLSEGEARGGGAQRPSILADAVDRVEKIRGEKIDIEKIPLDDKRTFEMLVTKATLVLRSLRLLGQS